MSSWLISYGSWCLAPFGLLGMWVVGQKKRWGWVLSMTTQALWAAYAVGTGQYGFLIGTCAYFLVYLRNWFGWGKEPEPVPDPWEGVCPYDCDRCHDEDTCTCPNCVGYREAAS